MLLIPCPHCGPRDQSEFFYGGTHAPQPALSAKSVKWHEAIHLRAANPEIQAELWYHESGCARWIYLRRDLKTHEFSLEVKL
ncbi:sarcosine oxidase subunit delta [Roseovarius sp. EL26]|uniref:sarcosine oxidase subunit delta n=1 Tax=Roseovarius sp. EL26 TaxID=2126672 RepID=UPI000EA40598